MDREELKEKLTEEVVAFAIWVPTLVLSLIMLIGGIVLAVNFFTITGAILVASSAPRLTLAAIKFVINYKKLKEAKE